MNPTAPTDSLKLAQLRDRLRAMLENRIGPLHPEWAYELTQLGFNEESFSPFIGMKTADNKFVPWLASQSDLLADDWWFADEAQKLANKEPDQ